MQVRGQTRFVGVSAKTSHVLALACVADAVVSRRSLGRYGVRRARRLGRHTRRTYCEKRGRSWLPVKMRREAGSGRLVAGGPLCVVRAARAALQVPCSSHVWGTAKKRVSSLQPPTDSCPGTTVGASDALPRSNCCLRTEAVLVFAGVWGSARGAGRLWTVLLLPAFWRTTRVQTWVCSKSFFCKSDLRCFSLGSMRLI